MSTDQEVSEAYIRELISQMFNYIGHYSNEMDEYASRLFERPVRGSWRIFVHLAKRGQMSPVALNLGWYWDETREVAHYPSLHGLNFEEFVTCYLHEVAHGWIYLLLDYEKGAQTIGQPDQNPVGFQSCEEEEKLCWEISRFVCKLLGIEFNEAILPDS